MNNGAEGARTPDPNAASVVLSQLSYSPNLIKIRGINLLDYFYSVNIYK